ncbi:MAG: Uncharacterized protein G01um10147_487 [Microgenomates group bacterium Gr01-1014_7]|nr:MAG: Uncharacterized protein G01um10147_487 [Microgenomates group bacterium Gr01-1014_7]
MEKQVLNYRIIIEPEKMGRKIVYNAACPTLGVYDYGDSIDEVLKSIKDGIELAIECLRDEGQEIPVDDTEKGVVIATQVEAPANIQLAIS